MDPERPVRDALLELKLTWLRHPKRPDVAAALKGAGCKTFRPKSNVRQKQATGEWSK